MQLGSQQEIRVLHVDDDPSITELTATFLEREGSQFSVETATGADEGLEKVCDNAPDCIVSDYNMPGMDGLEFLQAVREEYPDLPFILFTGKGSEEVASEAIATGVTDYIQKRSGPEQYELLANRIENAVESRRKAKRADRQEQLMRLTEFAGDTGSFEVDTETGEMVLTDGIRRILDISEDSTLDVEDTLEMTEPEARKEIRRAMDRAVETGEQTHGVWLVTPPDGEQRLLNVTYTPATPEEDDAMLRGAIRDITEQEKRQRERRLLQQSIDDANVSITLADPAKEDEPLVYVNDAFEEMTGYPAEEALGCNCRFLQGEDTDPEKVAALRDAVDNEEPVSIELRNYRKDGTEFWNRLTVTPIYDNDGELVRYLGTQKDVTERKERDERLTELNQATQALMMAETQQEVAEIGVEAASGILDLKANAIHFSTADDTQLVPVAHTEHVTALAGGTTALPVAESIAGRVYRHGEPEAIEDVQEDPDAHDPDTDLRSYLYLPLADHGVLLAGAQEQGAFDQQDITLGELLAGNLIAALNRVGRKQELREIKNQYQTLVENFPDGAVFLHDSDHQVVRAGGSELSAVGLSPESLAGKTPHDRYPPEIAEELVQHLDDALDGTTATFEQRYKENRYRIQTVPVRTDDVDITHVMAVSRNITEQAKRRQELERQNKRLEEFASIVSHDLQSPLGVAQGHLELAEERGDGEHLEKASDAIDRSKALIDDLLTLAQEGNQVDAAETVDLAEVAERSWQTVETAQAILEIGGPAVIEADPGRLQQLLENLYRNAIEHGGDDVTVSVGTVDDGFYVADAGPGIPESDRDEVFEAGYSTGENGTGFGLRIVEQIVDAHGWEITVTESEQGGARFEVVDVETAE